MELFARLIEAAFWLSFLAIVIRPVAEELKGSKLQIGRREISNALLAVSTGLTITGCLSIGGLQ